MACRFAAASPVFQPAMGRHPLTRAGGGRFRTIDQDEETMNERAPIPQEPVEPEIVVVDGVPTTTSVAVSEHFGRQHSHVMREIRRLIDELQNHLSTESQSGGERRSTSEGTVEGGNERPSTNSQTVENRPSTSGQTLSQAEKQRTQHLVNPRRYFIDAFIVRPNPSGGEGIRTPAYRLTRQGFTLLAMGFKGQKALRFKLEFMDAFARMEQKLQQFAADGAGRGAQLPPAEPARRRGRPPLALTGPAKAPTLSADIQALVDQRAWIISGSCHERIRAWLTDEVLRNCVDDYGRPKPNMATTLAAATFEAFATNWEAQRVESQLGLLDYVVKEMLQIRRGLRERQRKAQY
jgi:phage regulator Rha-like protein